MFEELTVQIKHQYGKYFCFHNPSSERKEPIFGKKRGCADYREEETIVRFIRVEGGYQIQHIYGKYLNFDNAYTESKEKVFGMNRGFHQDETVVDLIPYHRDRYRIRHQYGKYINFDNATSTLRERVYGMSSGYCKDETIVYLIPIRYNFSIKIGDFEYDYTKVCKAQINGQIKKFALINKTFTNNSDTNQRFSINEKVTVTTSTTFQHSTKDVTKWLNEVSVGLNITTEGAVALPLVSGRKVVGQTSCGYKYNWGKESTEEFINGTTTQVEQTINVTDDLTVGPKTKMNYKYIRNQLSGISVPYEAVMKIKCKMDGRYLSDEALKFVLDHIGNCPDGEMSIENDCGIYSVEITGELKLDHALNYSSYCDQTHL